MHKAIVNYCLSVIFVSQAVFGVELTFDLPDSSRECFHQEINKNTSATLEFQVINGVIFYHFFP